VFSGQPQHCPVDGSQGCCLSKHFFLLLSIHGFRCAILDDSEPCCKRFTDFSSPVIVSRKGMSSGHGFFSQVFLINRAHPGRLGIFSISIASNLVFLRSPRLVSLRNHKSPCQFSPLIFPEKPSNPLRRTAP